MLASTFIAFRGVVPIAPEATLWLIKENRRAEGLAARQGGNPPNVLAEPPSGR
jgi:hypothetical protein